MNNIMYIILVTVGFSATFDYSYLYMCEIYMLINSKSNNIKILSVL